VAGGAGRRVLVIGAGMAGLTALDRLSHAGFHVTVLEAQGRAGGRVRTVRGPFADQLYADFGASYVVDCHTRLLAYVDELDLPLQIVNPRHLASIYHLEGRNLPFTNQLPADFPLRLTAAERHMGFVGMLITYLSPGLKAVAQPSLGARWPDAHARALDRINGRQLLRDAGASNPATKLLGDSLLGLYGDGLDSTSGLFLTTQQKLSEFKVTYTIRGGMDRLPAALSARYRDRIHYGCNVTAIHHSPRGVRVDVRRGRATGRMEADFLVAAIPYAALRHVRIRPRLPSRKRRVVAELRNTSVVRAFVQCRTRFWERVDPSGTVFTDIPGLSIFSGYARPSHRGVLEAYICGVPARRLSAMRNPAPAIVRTMAQVFPDLPEFAEHVVWHCWDNDQWARGAYAWYAPREMMAFLPHLTRPEGRIHFAGDHTSLIPGWIEGAIESGERVASEIKSAR